MNWSQENCLIDDHCLTCERQEGDYVTQKHILCVSVFFGLFSPLEERAFLMLRFISLLSAFFFPRCWGRDASLQRGP